MPTNDERRSVAEALRAYAKSRAPWHLSDVLLALAEECDEMRDDGFSIGSYELYCIARRIREACGEVDYMADIELCKGCANYLGELGCLIFEDNDTLTYPGTCPDFIEEDEDEE